MDALSLLRSPDGSVSLSRTQAALAFLVCCGVVGWQAYKGTLSDVTFGLFFGFATAGYIGAKKIATDKITAEKKIDAGVNK
ncbi:hypothetical protein BTJ39_22340 [Izhakiella australiensis]|uniref:Uncharacterized protein n=1 Tax=Izhakiella australiensis TaxID=1926881 RepID=A0A1S8YA04_9GAMM|nr:hypothetical protein [Izhakiella australiensis]OON35618.1 hypothetical protein BTJ39_22340 [Izhakiella australiensis]